jgi:hypothetical protein
MAMHWVERMFKLEILDKRPPIVACEKLRLSNGAGFPPFPPSQHWTKRDTGAPNTLRHDGVYIALPSTMSQ